MWDIKADHAVSEIVDTMLPRFTPETSGVFITLSLSMTKYLEDCTNLSKHCTVNFLFTRPNNCTRVMACVGREINDREQWKMYSYHDSCWRSDGFRILSKVWGEMKEELGCHPSWQHCNIMNVRNAAVLLEKYDDERYSRDSYRPTIIKLQKKQGDRYDIG